MKPENEHQMDHWIRAMTRELLIHDKSSLSDKFEKIEMANQLAYSTYQRTSPHPADMFDNSDDNTGSE